MARIVVSVAWSGILQLPRHLTDAADIEVVERPSDWGLRGVRKRLHHLAVALGLLRRGRGARAIVIANAAIEMAVVAALQPLVARDTKLVAVDFLIPRSRPVLDRLLRVMRRYDRILCIRSGDVEVLARRFGIPRDRMAFVPFPAPQHLIGVATSDEGFVYSGGTAHRDWPTLVRAAEMAGVPTVIGSNESLELTEDQRTSITALALPSPEEARELLRRASAVAVICEPTELPSGPLVLLDAMALGKPVVATEVKGTVDYVTDGETGLLVPPHDADALARALRRLMDDPELRARLGAEGRRRCQTQFTPDAFASGLRMHLRSLGIDLR